MTRFLSTHDLFNTPFDIFFKTDFDNVFKSILSDSSCKVKYPYDIKIIKDEAIIDIAVIGLDKNDIKIKVEDDTLTVSSDKYKEAEDISQFIVKKIYRKNFSLSWKLDSVFDMNKIDVKLNAGLLTIRIPVKEEEKTKTREITIN